MTSDSADRIVPLLLRLIAATKNGMLKWEAAEEAAFILSRPQGSATIRSIDGDGSPPYSFGLLNEEGLIIETLTEDPNFNNTWDTTLAEMYATARASALNLDAAIAKWLKDVRELEQKRGGAQFSDEPPF